MTKGFRNKKSTLKNAHKFKPSSQKWLQRQMDDIFVKKAKAEGYKSRAAYKLLEIQEKYRLINSNNIIVDLGAAPGGWTQVVLQILKDQPGKVFALDILPMDVPENVTFIQGDFLSHSVLDQLYQQLGVTPSNPHPCVDIVLSDMAAPTTGHRQTDHLRIIALAEAALDFTLQVLKKDGSFVCKVFMGGSEAMFLNALKQHFQKVLHFKPKASRKDSTELYVIALHRK